MKKSMAELMGVIISADQERSGEKEFWKYSTITTRSFMVSAVL